MKNVSISGSPRVSVGKRDAKAVRSAGEIPCVIYGGTEQVYFNGVTNDFLKFIYSPEVYQFNINVSGKEYKAILQDIQFHPVTDKILHVDFLELKDNKAITIDIPVHLVGNSIGVKQGGKLIKQVRKLKVRALPADLPENITINVENLNIGQTIKVQDLKFDKLKLLDAPNVVVTAVRVTRAAVAAPEAAAAAKPAAAAPAAAKAAAPAAPAAAAKAPAKK